VQCHFNQRHFHWIAQKGRHSGDFGFP
jgi:hypothetical protein